ncbi:Mfa1 family fimbria major subunit [uncultured Bacteroides sp.]|uniref:Mfa1 family fimbria major subunit n=1 Tax=uncultured Bacteroides sp. TaxID=162156 RepID=UPI002AAB20BF|nr:Mfa1 family fimbria major subunit [uncultured Bacteroides sp.]
MIARAINRSKKIIETVIISLMITACNGIYDKYDDKGCLDNQNGTFISLTINTSCNTRSTPTGGETGDGQEDGQTNENAISDLTVFFYQGNDINQAIAANAVITGATYFGSSDIMENVTKPRQIEILKGTYHVIVVTNAGDLTGKFGTNANVKDLCDYLQKTAWVKNGNTYSQFVMSSTSDVSANIIEASQASPNLISVEVGRIAARIDFIPNKDNENTDLNNYLLKDNSNNSVAKIVINKIKLFNALNAGSYILKRVAASVSGTPAYLGNEEPVSGGIQTNYVIDPWSSLKTKDNLTGQHFSLTLGGSGTDYASSLYANNYSNNFSFSNDDAIKKSNLVNNGVNYYILGYTLENTTDKAYQLNGYCTGAMLETTYIPFKLTSYNYTNRINEITDNTKAVTFFTYGNGNATYNSIECIVFQSLKSSSLTNDFFTQIFTSSNTWQEVQDYINRFNENDLLGFKVYLQKKIGGQSLSNHLNETISWNRFVLEAYGYSFNDGAAVINQNGKDTRLLLSQLGIKCYENGLCYYPFWIRHSNNGNTDEGIMEFAVVRNNIYKLKVNSFSKIGWPSPYDPDPEDPVENPSINILVTVTPWRVITHPEIIL